MTSVFLWRWRSRQLNWWKFLEDISALVQMTTTALIIDGEQKSIWPLSGVDKNTPSSPPAREETFLDEKQNDFETLPEFQTTSALGLTWLERLNILTENFPLIYLKINRRLNLYLTLRFTYFAKKDWKTKICIFKRFLLDKTQLKPWDKGPA